MLPSLFYSNTGNHFIDHIHQQNPQFKRLSNCQSPSVTTSLLLIISPDFENKISYVFTSDRLPRLQKPSVEGTFTHIHKMHTVYSTAQIDGTPMIERLRQSVRPPVAWSSTASPTFSSVQFQWVVWRHTSFKRAYLAFDASMESEWCNHTHTHTHTRDIEKVHSGHWECISFWPFNQWYVEWRH